MDLGRHLSEQARAWVDKLKLLPHPEGGCYRETYRAAEIIPQSSLPESFAGARCFSTAIYYLLAGGDFSAFHRILSDEVWHYYDGGSDLLIHVISPDGAYTRLCLGRSAKALPQAVVPRGHWFAADVEDKSSFALVGCTVAPGFDFSDFEMGDRGHLMKTFPLYGEVITSLTRSG